MNPAAVVRVDGQVFRELEKTEFPFTFSDDREAQAFYDELGRVVDLGFNRKHRRAAACIARRGKKRK